MSATRLSRPPPYPALPAPAGPPEPGALRDASTQPAPAGTAAARRWRSRELFGSDSGHEVEIEHGDAVYRLRKTALGKLILTK